MKYKNKYLLKLLSGFKFQFNFSNTIMKFKVSLKFKLVSKLKSKKKIKIFVQQVEIFVLQEHFCLTDAKVSYRMLLQKLEARVFFWHTDARARI